jgi:hypothetical protein
LLRTLIRVSVA